MADRTLTVIPGRALGAPSVDDGPHPMEVARKALREAAMAEDGPWRYTLLRFADAPPLRGQGQ